MTREHTDIRPMVAGDYRQARKLLRQLSSGTYVWDDNELEDALASPGYRPYVAVQGEEIVGYAELHILPSPTWGRTARVENVVVDSTKRSGGIGFALCKKMIEDARDLGLCRFELRTEDAGARHMYEKLGFKMVEGSAVLVIK